MEPQTKQMTDEEATPLDWLLFHWLREELFNPKILLDENTDDPIGLQPGDRSPEDNGCLTG